MKDLPEKLLNFVEHIRIGLTARDSRRLDAEKVIVLLGKALREINESLQQNVEDCKATIDGADEERKRQEALAAAAAHLATRRQSVVDCKSALQLAAAEIDAQREAIKETKSAQRSSEAAAKMVQERKRHLEVVERDAFEPLREMPAGGLDSKKRLATLRRAGKDFGFHKELMAVAGVVLKKRLESRRTFDQDVLRNLAREFEKNKTSLEVAARESEEVVAARNEAVVAARDCVAAAQASRKQCAAEVVAAEKAIEEGQETLSETRRSVRNLPTHRKQMVKTIVRVQAQLKRFCSGPQAAYVNAFGALPAPMGANALAASSHRQFVAEDVNASETDVDEQDD